MKTKRILSAVMALTMVMGMVSCGDSAKEESKSGKSVRGFEATNGADAGGEMKNEARSADVEGISGETAEAEMCDDAGEAPDAAGEKSKTADADGFFGDAADAELAFDGFADDEGEGGTADKPAAEPEKEIPAPGQLTAGVWNDNNNWSFFANLVNSETISFPSFGIDPRERVAVTLKGDDGEPIANAKVKLLSSEGSSLWSAVTDRQGRAYLFSYGRAANQVEAEFGGEKQTFEVDMKGGSGDEQSAKKVTDNSVELTFKGHNGDKGSSDAQVMFIVDTTGSMCDELLFLQSEFSSLVKEVGSDGIEYAVNFYRDEGDDYVTKCSDFTTDVEKLSSLLMSESADGGGDIPEAVGTVMQESIIDNGAWKDGTVKIAFMIFDAPPHDEAAEQVESAVRAAAEKGIKLVPIVSSNSDRETELFGRAAAITTGGDYVFLTDDSGIGDSHLDPIVGDYEVEKLYDIIVRLISEYRD